MAGFQGINASSDVTTLGRGGSDLTAVALAAAPRPTAASFIRMSMAYIPLIPISCPPRVVLRRFREEMLKCWPPAGKVLQSRSVELRPNIPFGEVNSSFKGRKETLVTKMPIWKGDGVG